MPSKSCRCSSTEGENVWLAAFVVAAVDAIVVGLLQYNFCLFLTEKQTIC